MWVGRGKIRGAWHGGQGEGGSGRGNISRARHGDGEDGEDDEDGARKVQRGTWVRHRDGALGNIALRAQRPHID